MITNKFLAGRFQIQIRDWLRLGLHLSPAAMLQLAEQGRESANPAVGRHAAWLQARAEARLGQTAD